MWLLLATAALLGLSAHTAPVTWVGRGGDDLWTTAANWDCGCVPRATDDVALPAGARAVVATAAGAAARSIQLAAGVSLNVSANVTLGTGGLLALGNSTLILNGQKDAFVSSGPIMINGTAAALWLSGPVEGHVSIDTGASLTVVGSDPHPVTAVEVRGTLLAAGAANFAVTDRVQNYGLVWVNTSQGVTDLGRLLVDNHAAGRLVLNGTGRVLAAELDANAAEIGCNVSAGIVTLSNAQLDASLYVVDAGTLINVTGNNVTCAPAAILLLAGAIQLRRLQTGDTASCTSGAVRVDALAAAQHVLIGDDCPLRAGALAGTGLTLAGGGRITAENVSLAAAVRIASGFVLTATNEVALQQAVIKLDGALVVAATGSLLGQQGSSIGTSTASRPGALVVEGRLLVQGRFNLTAVAVNGTGAVQVAAGATLDLQRLTANLTQLAIGAGGAVTGETVILGWASLVGAEAGAVITIVTNATVGRCQSPCPARAPAAYPAITITAA